MSVTHALSHEQAIDRILELTALPQARRKSPWLVVMVGLPGSGKSTFARRLARNTDARVLESDILRAALFPVPTHSKEESRLLFDAIYGAARRLLLEGVTVVVDATNLRERDRQRAYEVAEATGAQLLLLHCRASKPAINERLGRRANGADPDDHSSAGPAIYAMMAETEEPILREHWKIDTSDEAATEAALQRTIETLKSHRIAAAGRHTGGSII